MTTLTNENHNQSAAEKAYDDNKNKKLLIIDGNSILNRAYWGIRPLTAPDGTPTNGVYGFLNIMFKHTDEVSYDYVCVAFDVKEKTFRHKMFDDYKAQRKPAPEDFLAQLPVIKEVLGAMNCLCLEKPGYEADDIIGTVAKKCDEEGIRCHILTGDKDDLQLATSNTTIKLVVTKGGKTTTTDYDENTFKEEYKIPPKSFIDVKALMGDTSDNIPGVAGIGEKTAMTLIQNFGCIDNIYNDLDNSLIKPGVRTKLIADKDMAYLSFKLATIDKNVPVEFDFDMAKVKEVKKDKLYHLLRRLNFKSFIQKFDLTDMPKSEEIPDGNDGIKVISPTGREEKTDFDTLFERAKEAAFVSYIKEGDFLYIKPQGKDILWAKADEEQVLRFFVSDEITKVGYNVKEDVISLSDYGIDAKECDFCAIGFDIMIAAYILDPTRSAYPMEDLCIKYMSAVLDDKSGKDDSDQLSMMSLIDQTDEEDKNSGIFAKLYAMESLKEIMSKEIEENGQNKLYYEVEIPLALVLAKLQLRGMYVDRNALAEFGVMLDEGISKLTEEIYNHAGEEFNINSPKQLGVILFEKLGLPYGKKSKSGSYSTNVEVLEKLRDIHPIAGAVLEYRQLAKLKSTYVTGLSDAIDKKTGRIHSHFNQTVTNTGRLSSTEPNLQNIPVRTNLGREIRKMFVAEKSDWVLIDADYSQIELRVLAHIADDTSMKDAFLSNADIHASTAATVFCKNGEEVTSKMRSKAKAVNFGIVYGIGAFSLAKDIGTTRKEAQEYIDDYLSHYSGIASYMKDIIIKAKSDGYITTVLERRRYIPELSGATHMQRAFGERVAMNAPIQGSAADIIKIAMVNTEKRFSKSGLSARLVLQVHDELIVEAPKSEVDAASKILKEEMENAYNLSVPLIVDMKSGKSWYDTK